jgi:hypothetical protein
VALSEKYEVRIGQNSTGTWQIFILNSLCMFFSVRNATNFLIPLFHSLDTLHNMFRPTGSSSGVWNCQNCYTALTSVQFAHVVVL